MLQDHVPPRVEELRIEITPEDLRALELNDAYNVLEERRYELPSIYAFFEEFKKR